MSTFTEPTSQQTHIRKSGKKKAESNSDQIVADFKSTGGIAAPEFTNKDVTATFDFTTTDCISAEVDSTTDFNNANDSDFNNANDSDFNNANDFEKSSSTSSNQSLFQNTEPSVFGNGKTGEEVKLQDPDQELDTKSQPQRARRKYVRGSRPARVTRISIERSHEESSTQIKPRLKNGVLLSAPIPEAEKSLIIATAHRAITIHHPGARAIIAKFDGEHSVDEISEELNAPVEVIENVISQLLNAQLIDVSKSKIRLHNRFHSPIAERAAHTEDQSNDASFRQLQQRMVSELSQTTWVEGVVDGGVEKLSARQNFGVEIYGSNRVATLIYNALLASGVTNTRFSITSRRGNGAIGDADLGTGVLRTTDYGLNYVNRLEELAREWSLFPTPSKNVKGTINAAIPERNLRIVVGQYSQALIAQFMRDGMDHLFVGQVVGGAALCGPLVIPAKSPCKECIELGISERFGMDQLQPMTSHLDELPVSIGYQVAGVASHSVLQFIDTGASEFIGAQLTFDYLSPVRGGVTRYARHPKCSCQWM